MRSSCNNCCNNSISHQFPTETFQNPKCLISKGKSGRRDWTRTNLPGEVGGMQGVDFIGELSPHVPQFPIQFPKILPKV